MPPAEPLYVSWSTRRPRVAPAPETALEGAWTVASRAVAAGAVVVVLMFLVPSLLLPGFGTDWVRGAIVGGACIVLLPLLSAPVARLVAARAKDLPPEVVTVWSVDYDRLTVDGSMRELRPNGLIDRTPSMSNAFLREVRWSDVQACDLMDAHDAHGVSCLRLYAIIGGRRRTLLVDLPADPHEAVVATRAIQSAVGEGSLTASERVRWTGAFDPRLGLHRRAVLGLIAVGSVLSAAATALSAVGALPMPFHLFAPPLAIGGIVALVLAARRVRRLRVLGWRPAMEFLLLACALPALAGVAATVVTAVAVIVLRNL